MAAFDWESWVFRWILGGIAVERRRLGVRERTD